METKRERILKQLKRVITNIDPTAKIILYGSRARGDAQKYSDWDFLILTSNPTSLKNEQKYRHILFELELKYGEAFSTLVCSKEDWEKKYSVTPLYENINREGLTL